MGKIVAALLLLIGSVRCFADWKFETHTSAGNETPPQVQIIYIKGQRVRSEVPNTGLITIYQCDQNHTVKINTIDKSYFIVHGGPSLQVEGVLPESQSGCCGVVHAQQHVTETGEHQQIFGLDAEHILTQIQLQQDTNACGHDANLQREVDGWYSGELVLPLCVSPEALAAGVRLWTAQYPPGARYIVAGKGVDRKLFPLKVTVRDTKPGVTQTSEMTREVVSLSSEPLPDNLFEVPEGLNERPAPPISASTGCSGISSTRPAGNFSVQANGTNVYRMGPGIVAPIPLFHPEPQYTDAARKAKVSGTLVLSLTVTADGSVRDLRIERSLRPDLDEQALNTVGTYRFQPGTKDGTPVAVRLNVEVSFNLR